MIGKRSGHGGTFLLILMDFFLGMMVEGILPVTGRVTEMMMVVAVVAVVVFVSRPLE